MSVWVCGCGCVFAQASSLHDVLPCRISPACVETYIIHALWLYNVYTFKCKHGGIVLHISMFVRKHIYIFMHACTHTYTHVHTHMYIYIVIHVCQHIYKYMAMMYLYMYLRMYVSVYVGVDGYGH